MPTLRAESYADLVQVIGENERDVRAGVYDFVIEPAWVQEMSAEAINFFAARPTESAALAKSPFTPSDVLAALLRRDRRHALTIATNASASSNLLLDLAKTCGENEAIANAVASHPNATSDALWALAGAPSIPIQELVASSMRAPPACLGELAKSNSARVREAVAQNSLAPSNALGILRRDADASVKEAVGRNPKVRKQEGRCASCGAPLGFLRKALGSETCGKH